MGAGSAGTQSPRWRRRGRRLAAVTAAVTALGCLGTAVASAAPTVTLSTPTGTPTTGVTVGGAGYNPYEIVDVYWDTQNVARVATDGTGAFSGAKLKVPTSADPGQHWVVTQGLSSHYAAMKAFTVRTNWTQPGFGASHAGFNGFENVLNTGNVDELGLDWSGDMTLGKDDTSPVVAGGVAYMVGADGYVYAFSTTTHERLWKTALPAGTGGIGLAYANNVLYITAYTSAGNGMLVAMNTTTHKVAWTAGTGYYNIANSPAVAGNVVYTATTDGVLSAFPTVCGGSGKPVCGTPLWTANAGSGLTGTPAIYGDNGPMVYVVAFDGKVRAYPTKCGGASQPACGTLAWWGSTSQGDAGSIIYGGASTDGQNVYVGANNGKVFAFRAKCQPYADGMCYEAWSAQTPGAIYGTPAVANGVVYVPSDGGLLVAYKANCSANGGTCGPVWVGGSRGSYYGPTVANGVVYTLDYNTHNINAFAVGCATGGATCQPLSTVNTQTLWSAPVISDGAIYIGSRDGLDVYDTSAPPAGMAAPKPQLSQLHSDARIAVQPAHAAL